MGLILDNYELRISSIIKKYMEVLFRNPNIVGFGRGFKNKNGNLTNEPCLIIYVKKKVPICNLDKDKIIPKYFNGALTDVYESGKIKLKGSVIFSGDEVANINNKVEGEDENDPDSYNSGTITCALSEIGVQKNIYLLGCNHVLTREKGEYEAKGKLQDKIIQLNSTAKKITVIGQLCDVAPLYFSYTEKMPLNSVMDAALVYVGPINDENKKKVSPRMTKNGRFIKGTTLVNIGEAMEYYGFKSGFEHGKVASVGTICYIANEKNNKTMKILLEDTIGVDVNNNFGDSGALGIVNRGNGNFAFGMLVAGSDRFTYFTPLNTILRYFKLKLLEPFGI